MTRLALALIAIPALALTPEQADREAALCAARIGGMWSSIAATGSMRPALDERSRIVYEAAPFDSLRAGDVVVVKWGSRPICHRLVRKSGDGWISKGDANLHYDPVRVTRGNYVGRVVVTVEGRK